MGRFLLVVLSLLLLPEEVRATGEQDWPTHRGDNARSGHTPEALDLQKLSPLWVHEAGRPPSPAWPGPAKWDAYAALAGLKSMRNYDPVFHPTAAGEKVYYGSSTDDSVYCLDAQSGEVVWSFSTGGAVRAAPSLYQGRLYFGSDDGHAYCVDAITGEAVWKWSPSAEKAPRGKTNAIINNGRIISRWPVRTGVAVEGGVAYFAASLLPWEPSYLCAVDANTGRGGGRHLYVRELPLGNTLEGSLLVSKSKVIVPQGRISPLVFDRSNGTPQGSLEGGGGSFVLLTDDDHVLHGPGNKQGWLTDSKGTTRERVATYERGIAVVVDEKTAYLLGERSLTALDRETQAVFWSVSIRPSHTLIQAGDVLFIGADNVVEARSVENGRRLWAAPVRGAAHGIAVARGRLLVSTDQGVIHAFGDGTEAQVAQIPAVEYSEEEVADVQLLKPPHPIGKARTRGLLDRWVFQQNGIGLRQVVAGDPRQASVVANQMRKRPDARPLGEIDLGQVGAKHAAFIDGSSNDFVVAADFNSVDVPTRGLSVEAWVRVDVPLEWGGIVSIAQDNGSYERGWILGYRGKKFGFAVATRSGPGRLTWITDQAEFTPGSWNHVAGTYDGKTQRLFVNGQEVAHSNEQKGAIWYPDEASYHIGAYRDADEYFRMTGMVHEVRVYDRALPARDLANHHEAEWERFPSRPATPPPAAPVPTAPTATLASGPRLRFIDHETAEVRFETREALPATVSYAEKGSKDGPRVIETRGQRHHVALLGDLHKNRVYEFSVSMGMEKDAPRTRQFEMDTHFNFHVVEDYGDSDDDGGVADLVSNATTTQGFCVVLGCSDDSLASRLAHASEFQIVILTSEQDAALVLRNRLRDENLLGSRVQVVVVDEKEIFASMPDRMANLLLIDPAAESEASRLIDNGALHLVRPYGGVAVLPRQLADRARRTATFLVEDAEGGTGVMANLRRGEPEGAGEWTHMYGSPDNSAFAHEKLSGADSVRDLRLQWLGRPGPRHQSDRQNRKPSPLAVNGRLFVQGLHRVIAMDAYNGTILWSLESPELARFNVPRSSSNWCADGDFLYLARGRAAWKLDGATGVELERFDVPGDSDGSDREWGYIANADGLLLGSAVPKGAQYTEFWGSARWYDQKEGPGAWKVISDRLFALDPLTGEQKWSYDREKILDCTITIADGHVFFVELGGDLTANNNTGRAAGTAIWDDLHLICLDIETGETVWEREADPMPGVTAFYLAHSEGKLVMQSSSGGSFAVYVFDASDGKSRWRKKFAWEVDHHGKHLSHLAVLKGALYVRPLVFDLDSGQQLDRVFPVGHQCGTYVASEDALIMRAGNLTMWDVGDGSASSWPRVRPDCWISTIPANGMLLSPEGGGGCSCGSWIESSMGFVPTRG